MKAWRDLSTVPMPEYLQRRPKDARGYPVSFISAQENGQPSFVTMSGEKALYCASKGLCGLCGNPVQGLFAFVGGERCLWHRHYLDVGMHEECAKYALQVCPFLAAPKFGYQEKTKKSTERYPGMVLTRPTLSGLGMAKGYRVEMNQGHLVLYAAPWKVTELWDKGTMIERKEYA